jgi:carboxyl-terminal processing protease
MRARDLTLTRAYVPAPSVRAELRTGGVALLTIDRFHLSTATEFERRLSALMEQAGDGLSGIVVDLRNNLGGVIKPAAEIADGFLDEGLVVYTRGRYPASRLEYQALPGQWAAGVPLVVLVNGQSASASEIVAAALQDHERALLVGARTYGKGTVQSIVELRNGSALKLTTARYYTPSGRTFDGTGIEPDVVVASGNATDDEPREGQDEALEHALDLLRRGEVPTGAGAPKA